jgi:hypothetical protein
LNRQECRYPLDELTRSFHESISQSPRWRRPFPCRRITLARPP